MSFHSYGSVPYGLNNILQRTKYQWYQWDPSLLSPASCPCAQSPPMNSLTVSWYSVSICRTSSWGSHPRQAPRNGSGLCLKSWLSEKFYIHVSVSYKVICLSIFQSNVFYDVSLLLSLVFPAEITTLTDEKKTHVASSSTKTRTVRLRPTYFGHEMFSYIENNGFVWIFLEKTPKSTCSSPFPRPSLGPIAKWLVTLAHYCWHMILHPHVSVSIDG